MSKRVSMAARMAEALVRIRARLERDFPIGSTVKYSALGRSRFPQKHRDRQGVVVGYSHGVSPNVLWEGRKTPSGYSADFLQTVRKPHRRRRRAT